MIGIFTVLEKLNIAFPRHFVFLVTLLHQLPSLYFPSGYEHKNLGAKVNGNKLCCCCQINPSHGILDTIALYESMADYTIEKYSILTYAPVKLFKMLRKSTMYLRNAP